MNSLKVAKSANGHKAPAEPTRALLKQHAYAELKRLILDTTFGPGDFLSERQLAARLGMSKTPVRAALERLEAEGFISVAPQQGIVVRELSIHEIADQFEIRVALETFVVRSIAKRLTRQDAQRLQDNLATQRLAVEQNEVARSAELDADYHILFCEILGNSEITRVMSQLREKIHRIIARVFEQDSHRLAASFAEHQAIADALLAGDGDLAAQRVEEHLEYGKQFLLSPRRQ